MCQSIENPANDSLGESKVVRIWTDVLKLEDGQIDLDSTFLELGGDSLSAVLCMSRLRGIFGSSLDSDLSDFFDSQSTIRNFAIAIARYNSTDITLKN